MCKDLTICIPAYNEEQAIGDTLRALKAAVPDAEIIVVDDGSQDATATVAAVVPEVKVLSHERNRGYGAALKTAMRNASRKLVLWYDADRQHRVEDVHRIVQPVLDGGNDVVIGVRKNSLRDNPERNPGKLALKILAELIARDKVPDVNSGLRCFRSEVIKKYLHLLPDGFSASTTSTLLMMKRGYRVGYVDIVTHPRLGKSTVRIFRDGLRTLQLMIRILVLFEAFGFFTALSLLQIIPGGVYGLYMALTTGRGVPTLAATIVMSGIFTFFMGILCDQITELRKEKFEE